MRFLPLLVLVLVAILLPSCGEKPTYFEPQEHVVFLGNGLPDRMQHDAWLETYLQSTHAEHELVIRNHGFMGDRVNHRPRNQGFLAADDYLTISKATTVLAFFGYNESFDDNPEGFGEDLQEWILHTRSQNYSGLGPPRIVLISPPAHEDLQDANFPDGKENNVRLNQTMQMMKTVAEEMQVDFVDLFQPTLHAYAMKERALTINGVHFNKFGNRVLGKIIADALLGYDVSLNLEDAQTLRTVIQDKNHHWFNRYRATDGNDVWGSRSGLSFTDGQSNADVLQHELSQLDVMTANRDQAIWAEAQGKTWVLPDINVPSAVEVISNLEKPQLQGGVSKIGDGTYLSPEEGLKRMTLAQGLSANLFASEDMFPEMVNPVQLGVGPKGRLWAATWTTYPKWEPLKEMNDRLLILPDENRDGVADKAITFAKVHNPTGFEFWNGGVLVASAPGILFLKDTDGDDIADVRYRILDGIDSADTHHTANNFVYGPDGYLYYQRGVFHVSNVETPWETNQQSGTSGMYRFNPRTHEFSFHANNSPNPHGISFDYWGYHYATDATGGRAFQVVPDVEGKFKMRKLLNHSVRPVASSGILSTNHFPEKYQGNFLLCNTIAFLGIKQYQLDFNTENGEVNGTELENFLVSTDPNFRPTDFEEGDDGAVYVSDWANAIIGHMQHNVRDPQRDHKHGRIYRITADGRPLSKHVAVADTPISHLLDLLKHPVNGVRHRARVELSGRNTDNVMEATQKWVKQFDPLQPQDAHHLLEALWLHQQHNVKNTHLLHQLLQSPEPNARIAAQRVDYLWKHAEAPPKEVKSAVAHPSIELEPAPEGAIVIQTVLEEMRYDVKEFTVTAGEEVSIWFQNPDFMPHNLVIGLPSSADEIGRDAEAMGADGFQKSFIPENDKILAASGLLNYGESELITFTAPNQPGHYDIVCTFPGHWKLMRGTMVVEPKIIRKDAGWCWFQDERAWGLGEEVVIGSVAYGAKDPKRKGDVELHFWNPKTGSVQTLELHDQLQADDHNAPAILPLPNKQLLTTYAGHGLDSIMRARVINADRTLQDEVAHLVDAQHGLTYANLHTLKDGNIVNFCRAEGWDPNILQTQDQGKTWKHLGRLLGGPGRPYLKYQSNQNQVHFINTEQHPRDFDNHLYHGIWEDGNVLQSNGTVVGQSGENPPAPHELTQVFEGTPDTVAWPVDLELTADGHPVCLFSVQVDGRDAPRRTAGMDHRLYYGTWNGSAWKTQEIGFAGKRLYAGEDDYTGLAALHPQNLNVVYLSTDAHPKTGAPLISKSDGQRHHEIFRGEANQEGVWTWSAVTEHSKADNLRPVIPHGSPSALLWLRGSYQTYTKYELDLVGILIP
ncbi:MAG: BNR-4 repeat-containing protein [Planctomycetota bacterium]|nr:BNR-4 repeat-containing protein [Planctomycetota bacterium]